MLKLTPSNAPRWVPCPGSVALEAAKPDNSSDADTADGDALHWACDRVLASWLPVNAIAVVDLQGMLGQTAPNGVVITPEMVWAGGIYLEEIWKRAGAYVPGLQIEKQLSAHALIAGLAGRTDAIWRSADRKWLTVWDLKYGRVPKFAYENWQLISYIMGAIDTATETLELVLVQPRSIAIGAAVHVWAPTVPEFMEYVAKAQVSALNARSDAPTTAAGSWCRYCKVAATCQTLARASHAAQDLAGRAVDLDMDERSLAYELSCMDTASDQLRARKDALEALAIARIQAGKPVPGYGYTPGQGNRAWNGTVDEVLAMGKLFDVDLSDTKALSPAKAEGLGIPQQLTGMFTSKKQTGLALRRVDRNEARTVFYE